ncbi:hypothetical protein ABE44_09205, partial [Bacillus thuringiensis]|nr:hypothetical protein [Bacillus thuringiensis]
MENCDFVSIDDQLVSLNLDLTLEATVGRVILEHVDHVLQVDERVVDGHDLHLLGGEGSSGHQTTDAAESIDTDFHHFVWVGLVLVCEMPQS